MQLSPDQLDDILARGDLAIDYDESIGDLDPRLVLLAEINSELTKMGGNAGTHAYEMMAAVEEINAGDTRVLIELIAAVVMWKAETRRGNPPMSVTFQPSDIDRMQRAYHMEVKRDGMHVTVTLNKRDETAPTWQLDEAETGADALDQATAPPERPVWAVRTGAGALIACTGREDAETQFQAHHSDDALAAVENRYCLHETCPSTGCNLAEVTSDA